MLKPNIATALSDLDRQVFDLVVAKDHYLRRVKEQAGRGGTAPRRSPGQLSRTSEGSEPNAADRVGRERQTHGEIVDTETGIGIWAGAARRGGANLKKRLDAAETSSSAARRLPRFAARFSCQ